MVTVGMTYHGRKLLGCFRQFAVPLTRNLVLPVMPCIHKQYTSNFVDCKSESEHNLVNNPDTKDYVVASDPETESLIKNNFLVVDDFISESEEESLFGEIEPYLKRLRYETDHWDDAIHGYRETERKHWTEANKLILSRVQDVAFPPGTAKLAYVHVLDIQKNGYIKAHVDSIRFCGSTIAGISMLSSSVMRLANEKKPEMKADVLLKRRSLYVMTGAARYDYTHEVLKEELSVFKGQKIPRDRRISVILRNEASPTNQT